MLKKDQFYKDILDGLSLFYESRFIKDIRNTALKYPTSSLGNALNRRQTASKLWLLDSLNETHGGDLGSVHILGGWCGVLASLLFHDSRFKVNHTSRVSISIPVARQLQIVLMQMLWNAAFFPLKPLTFFNFDTQRIGPNK